MRRLEEQENTPAHDDVTVDAGRPNHFFAEIGNAEFAFETVRFDDAKVTSAEVAEAVNAHPVADFRVLQQLKSGEIETLRPNETANLSGSDLDRFFVVRSDRSYDFTIDGLAMEWPLADISGLNLRILARADEHQGLVQVTPAGFMPIEDDAVVSFEGKSTEEFRLIERPRTVTVFYREEPYELERRGWTTEELMTVFGVPAGYKLDLIEPDDSFKELKPGHTLQVREGMEFTSHAPVGQSS